MLKFGQGPPTLQNVRWDQFALFKGLAPSLVSQCIQRMKVQTFHAGEPIIKKGTIGTSMYMIDSGSAHAVVCGTVAQVLSQGDSFGEIAFMATCRKIMKQCNRHDATLRSCDVQAAEHTRVVTIAVADFLAVFYNNLGGSQAAITAVMTLESLAGKNRETIRRIERRNSEAALHGDRCARDVMLKCEPDAYDDHDAGHPALPLQGKGRAVEENDAARIRRLRLKLEERKGKAKRGGKKDRIVHEMSVLASIYCHFNCSGGGSEKQEEKMKAAVGVARGPGCRDAFVGKVMPALSNHTFGISGFV